MKKWLFKTAVQRVISWLPASHRWNELLQRYVTKGLTLTPASFEEKLICCRHHLDYYLSFSQCPREDFTVLELGTGWFPILPLGLYLCGAGRITTYDIDSFLHAFTFKRVLELFEEFDREGRLQTLLPQVQPERLKQLRDIRSQAGRESPKVLLERLHIFPVLRDARDSGHPPGSIDLVFSNFVLEHISRDVLVTLLTEFKRVLSPSGVMTHHIGLADQYASFDSSITPFNFLKYPSKQWRFLNNPIIPLTRLRIADYRALLLQTGFDQVAELNIKGSLQELRQVKLAPEFACYTEEDLLVLFSWLVARRPEPERPGIQSSVSAGRNSAPA